MSIRLVAHRGDCQFTIENTLGSIKTALENGIKAVEIDVQFSKDGTAMLFHDRTLSRFTEKKAAIASYDYQTLQELVLKQPKSADNAALTSNFCTLDELVALMQNYPEVTLFVEVKRINFLFFSYQQVYQQILTILAPILTQIVVISFSYRFLRLCRKAGFLPLGYVIPGWSNYCPKMLTLLKPDYIFCDIDYLPENYIFSNAEFIWVLYEVGSVELAQKYRQQGALWLETFTPSLLRQQLKAKSILST